MPTVKKRRRSDDSESSPLSSSSSKATRKISKGTKPKSFESSSLETSIVSLDSVDTEASKSQNVRVVARVRPLSSKEQNEDSNESVKTDACSIVVQQNRRFEYDAVFGPKSTQKYVYEGTAGDMVKTNVFKGFNVTILAYGQTGSGKTFTMGTNGGNGSSDNVPRKDTINPPSDSDGVIPRAVYDLFQTRETMEHGKDRVKVEMSYLEIYNEEARDLLCKDSALLHIRDGKDGVVVQNLSLVQVKSPSEVSVLMESASGRRATASTAMNAVSSRSHAICTLNVTISPPSSFEAAHSSQDGSEDVVIRSKLTLVDLAGSERIKKTGAEGNRMKEGININKGLFVLGQVIAGLSELGQQPQEATKHTHIPYRDSKLTRLLQDSLGGNSRTVMVACVSPASSNVEESVNTLRYAQRTRNIHNSAVRNVVENKLSLEEAAALRRENQMLKLQLLQARAARPTQQLPSMDESPTQVLSLVSGSDLGISGLSAEKLDLVTKLRTQCVSLQCKMEQMETRVQSAEEDALETSLRADRWELKYNQVVAVASDKGLDVLNEMPAREEAESLASQLRKEIGNLKSQLKDAQTDAEVARATAAAVVVGGGDLASASEFVVSNDESIDSGAVDEEQGNQATLTAALVSMSGQIEQKEAMVLQMNKERQCMDNLRSHFEGAVHRLQEEVDSLSSERDKLLRKMEQDTAGPAKKLHGNNDQMRSRIKDLETRISELKRKTGEHKKTLRLREIAERKCVQLAAEIKEDKRRRAELQRKLKEESQERRLEQKAARLKATRMLRDRQRLEYELKKVKDSAERQAAVLRRKNSEARSRQKRMAEQQRKRNMASSIRKNGILAKNIGGTAQNDGRTRQDELQSWLELEVESSLTLMETKHQIQEHTALLEESSSRRKGIADPTAARNLDDEIEMRSGIIKQLKQNLREFQKARSLSPRASSSSSSSHRFSDATTWNSLSRSEAKFLLTNAFEYLLEEKLECKKLKLSQKESLVRAVNKAVEEEKRLANDTISELKMQHSEHVMTLLESTKTAVEHEVLQNIKETESSDGDEAAFKSMVDEMLGTYLQGCTKVGTEMKQELHDIRNQQDGMRRMVDQVAKDIIASKEVASTNTTKKKAKKPPSTKSPEIEDEIFIEEEDEAFEDSDDSDWNPETPAKKRRMHEGADTKNTKRPMDNMCGNERESVPAENQSNNNSTDTLEKLKVAELREMLRQRGLAVSGKKTDLLARLRIHESASTSSGEGMASLESKENQPPKSPTMDVPRNDKRSRKPLAPKQSGESNTTNQETQLSKAKVAFQRPLPSGDGISEALQKMPSGAKLTFSAKKRRRRGMADAVSKALMEAEKIQAYQGIN